MKGQVDKVSVCVCVYMRIFKDSSREGMDVNAVVLTYVIGWLNRFKSR